MADTPLPTVTSYVDQKWFLEPLTGDQHPRSYLRHLPEEIFNTGPDSHLTRFMYALLGPSGVGFLRQNALEARLRLEEMGLELFDLEAFYGEPLGFTRITEEIYADDPRGLVDRQAWDKIRAKDAQYRARVLDFLDGVRAGNTPLGMRLVAKSGLGHDVSIIENYRALFDEYADEPLGLVNYGKTRFTEEMIVLPRREVAASEVQIVRIEGDPTGGTFSLFFTGEQTAGIAPNANSENMRTFLEALPSIQPGDIEVSGGYSHSDEYINLVANPRAALNLTTISATGGYTPTRITTDGVSSNTSVEVLAPTHPNNTASDLRFTPPDLTTQFVRLGDKIRIRVRMKRVVGSASPVDGGSAIEYYAHVSFRKQDGTTPTGLYEWVGQLPAGSPADTWIEITNTVTVGVYPFEEVDSAAVWDIGGAGVGIWNNSGSAKNMGFRATDLLVAVERAEPIPYFDGGTANAVWLGTAHNSRSQLFVNAIHEPYRVRFTGRWGGRAVPEMTANGAGLTGGTTPTVFIDTEQEGVDAADEIAYITDADKHHLQEALDRLRSLTIIPTIGTAPGLRSRQLWGTVQATSEYDEVVRYVTGNAQIPWPGRDTLHWIEKGIEREAPKAIKDRQYQYMAYHNVQTVSAFSDAAVIDPDYGSVDTPEIVESNSSAHVGPFSEFQTRVYPFLATQSTVQYLADMVLADQPEPLTIRNIIEEPTSDATITQLINGIYPQDYVDLPGVPPIKYDYEQFWASREAAEGIDYLEIDLGTVRGINHLQFETTNKPISVSIEFDLLDLNPRRHYTPVNIDTMRSSSLVKTFVPENLNPWSYNEFNFLNDNNELIFTRFIRIGFERINNLHSPFLISGTELDPQYHPWSIDVRNLRVGRNVTNM